MSEHFDAVIVGSGFGGSVMAFRLADAGMRVCVLERGKKYPPGSFPRSPLAMRDNFWDPSEGRYGLFNVWGFSGLDAVVSSGLGGGSLIYANVLLRKDEKWFVREDLSRGGHEDWPVTRRELDPHYERVENMLHGQEYPYEHPAFADTPKLRALKAAAAKNGYEWITPKLAVAFRAEGTPGIGLPLVGCEGDNMFGVTRSTCRRCGECNFGCNFGSKATLDLTYLSRAVERGAVLRTGAEVRHFAPQGGGYVTKYIDRGLDDPDREPTENLRTITSDYLVVAAGALGSTFLLLRHAAEGKAFRKLSPRLGTRFSGNGDLLTFVLDAHNGDMGRRLDPTIGPVITSAIRVPDALDGAPDGARGFYVEDAGYPDFVAWLAEWGTPGRSRFVRGLQLVWDYLCRVVQISRDTNLGAELSAVLGDAVLTGSSLPLLSMGRDIPDGVMSLNRHGRLDIDWCSGASSEFFDRVRGVSREIAASLGGRFLENPLSTLRRMITVHPLGGCPMGRNADEGVVDCNGEVFGHPGLYIADGSVMPGPVGPNPALTIGALSDRFADALIDRWHQHRSRRAPATATTASAR